MASFRDELAKLTNPNPIFDDPEDDTGDVTSAKVLEKNSADIEDTVTIPSRLRQKVPIFLADSDTKYAGKKTSRKKIKQLDDGASDEELVPAPSDDEESDAAGMADDDDDDKSSQDLNASSSVDDSDSEDLDQDIHDFRAKLGVQGPGVKKDVLLSGSGIDSLTFTDDDEDNVKSDDSTDEEESDGDASTDEEEADRDSLDDDADRPESNLEGDDVQKFSSSNRQDEMKKGNAAKAQIALWDALLEGKIKLQKSSCSVNQLPHPDTWSEFQREGGDSFTQASKECEVAIRTLLDKLLELQTVLLLQYPETRHVVEGAANTKSSSPDEDEEILSDSDAEEKTEVTKPVKQNRLKRKYKMEVYPEELAKRHENFKAYRNVTIQKWSDKTQLASGKLKRKSFSAFDQSTLKKIDQILSDKQRLIKRTQLKRSLYRVLGQEENQSQEKTDDLEEQAPQDPLKNYDGEIFDDDDFYHQLLRELIERKTSDISDPVALSRQWLEIQKLRSKVKKKVDTKASKGRKMRYDVHNKLINFMAPIDAYTWTDESKNDLFKSLFGRRFMNGEGCGDMPDK